MKAYVKQALRSPIFRGAQPFLQRLYLITQQARGRAKRHPFDVQRGVRTSGSIPAELLSTNSLADTQITAYLGCVPSAVRAALVSIPDISASTFIDLGCGMGRAMLIASEFNFAEIYGVELNPNLATIAIKNVKKMFGGTDREKQFRIVVADATEVELALGDCVIFIYHSFMRSMVSKLLDNISAQDVEKRKIYIVYENPVFYDVIDAHRNFNRWRLISVPYDKDEIGYGPDCVEPIAIWANEIAGETPYEVDRKIAVVKENWRAEIL